MLEIWLKERERAVLGGFALGEAVGIGLREQVREKDFAVFDELCLGMSGQDLFFDDFVQNLAELVYC